MSQSRTAGHDQSGTVKRAPMVLEGATQFAEHPIDTNYDQLSVCTLEILGWSDVFDALVGCFSLFGSAVLV